MSFRLRRIAGHCARTSRQANGIITAIATSQRMKTSAKGVTCPAMARPMTQLSDQKSAVRPRRRYGDAWSVRARRSIEGVAKREAQLYPGGNLTRPDAARPAMSENIPAPEEPQVDRKSAWAPLRIATFRTLWLVWLASNTCMWMNDVAAAWLMTSLTTSPTLIALVTTASSLPVFLLGLPSGAFADILDRRRYFMVTQFWIAANAAVIYGFAITGQLTA